MSDTNIKAFNIEGVDRKVDYSAIENVPAFATESEIEALKDEINSLKLAAGGTVVLSKDIVTPERFWISGDTTLDLNGHSIKTSQKYLFVVKPGASLTINDTTGDGKITATYNENEGAIKVDGGTLTINGGTITSGSASQGGVIFAVNGAIVNINGGDLSSASAVVSGNNLQGDINVNVTGGTLTTKFGPAIYLPGQGVTNISGGTINGGISARMGQINVTGGEINATTDNIDSPAKYYNYSGNAWLPDAIYVFGGTYTSSSKEYGNSLNLKITGGKITAANGQGSAVAIYDIGKVEQAAKVTIGDKATLTTNAENRHGFDVLSLSDIGVTAPAEGYGKFSGKIVVTK